MSKTITLGAVGDIAFCGQTAMDLQAKGTVWPFEKIVPVLNQADLLFGNFECVFCPPDFPDDQTPDGLVYTGDPALATKALQQAGFDFLNLAGNHALDAGVRGIEVTRDTLEHAGIRVGGTGLTQSNARQLQILETHGCRVGFLCYAEDCNYSLGQKAPGFSVYEVDRVVEDIRQCRSSVDILVVSIHADLEFLPTPSLKRRDESRAIASVGADLILQHHPHVPQGIEMIGGTVICYSLGNCMFNAHTSPYMKENGPETMRSFILLVDMENNRVSGYRRVPFSIEPPPNQRPVLQMGQTAEASRLDFEALDKHLPDADFLRTVYLKRAREIFDIHRRRMADTSLDLAIEDVLGRLMLVAENVSLVDALVDNVRQKWATYDPYDDPFHAPSYRYKCASSKTPP